MRIYKYANAFALVTLALDIRLVHKQMYEYINRITHNEWAVIAGK